MLAVATALDVKDLDLKSASAAIQRAAGGGAVEISNAAHLHGALAGLKKGEYVVGGDAGDYLGESADLAVGPVGSQQGYSTVIVRTPAGLAAVQNATTMKLLETLDAVDAEALARAGAEKDRRERAQAFDEMQVMLLDALADPRRRAEVKQKFDMMYGGSHLRTKKEDYRYAGCGDCSGC